MNNIYLFENGRDNPFIASPLYAPCQMRTILKWRTALALVWTAPQPLFLLSSQPRPLESET